MGGGPHAPALDADPDFMVRTVPLCTSPYMLTNADYPPRRMEGFAVPRSFA